MAWFADWLRTKGFTTGGPRCAFPNHLQDRPIHALPSHEFRCTGMYSRRNLDSNIFDLAKFYFCEILTEGFRSPWKTSKDNL